MRSAVSFGPASTWGVGYVFSEQLGNRGCLGATLWRRPNPWDRRSILSVRRLARTDFDTNDSPTAGPPHKCTDAVSKAEEPGSKVALLDLLDLEEEADIETPPAIPGAFRIDPSRLRTSPRIGVPDDVEIVLHCFFAARLCERAASGGTQANRCGERLGLGSLTR